jgi:zinc/manganese transport system substrate-binding protein
MSYTPSASRALAFAALLLIGRTAMAIDVVATSSSGGMLVREIAGERAEIEILAPPNRDLHYLQARPSMMRAVRGADLLVAIGADIELGWLPVALQQSANPNVLTSIRSAIRTSISIPFAWRQSRRH